MRGLGSRWILKIVSCMPCCLIGDCCDFEFQIIVLVLGWGVGLGSLSINKNIPFFSAEASIKLGF